MSFYLGRYAELYDLFYRDKPYGDEARFVYEKLTELGKAPPRRVLELACGTGTHAIELAKLGCSVTATDCSPSMLEVAARKGRAAGVPTAFSECDMQALPRPETPYDAVICLFDSIGYVQTDERLAQVFQGVRGSLSDGGLFVFEFWHAPTMQQKFDPLRVRRLHVDGSDIIRISETNLVPGAPIAQVKYDIYALNKDSTYEHFTEVQSNRFFTVSEMDSYAPMFGFERIANCAGFVNSEDITDDTWHVLSIWRAVARRGLR